MVAQRYRTISVFGNRVTSVVPLTNCRVELTHSGNALNRPGRHPELHRDLAQAHIALL
jgi:hypothetical protein